ncbi:hypothetical protein GUO98_004399 [Salmonella enterica]|nr:hypothetical protein [Salmonella enterica]EEJ8658965.1 hypothetical protein [Salmonella enterica subsp. enterica]
MSISSKKAAQRLFYHPELSVRSGKLVSSTVKVGVSLGNGIYGHSRFCNTDFDDKWACSIFSGA